VLGHRILIFESVMHLNLVSRPLGKWGIEGQRPISVDWHIYFRDVCFSCYFW